MNKAQVRRLMVGDKLIYFPMGAKSIGTAQVVYLQEIITDVRETYVPLDSAMGAESKGKMALASRGAILLRVCDKEEKIDILLDGFTVNANALMPFVPKFWERLQAINREAALVRQLAADYLTGTKVEMPLVPAGRILPSIAAEKSPATPFKISGLRLAAFREETP